MWTWFHSMELYAYFRATFSFVLTRQQFWTIMPYQLQLNARPYGPSAAYFGADRSICARQVPLRPPHADMKASRVLTLLTLA